VNRPRAALSNPKSHRSGHSQSPLRCIRSIRGTDRGVVQTGQPMDLTENKGLKRNWSDRMLEIARILGACTRAYRSSRIPPLSGPCQIVRTTLPKGVLKPGSAELPAAFCQWESLATTRFNRAGLKERDDSVPASAQAAALSEQ